MRARLIKKKSKQGRQLSNNELKRAIINKEYEIRKLQERLYISLCELAEYRTENKYLLDTNYEQEKEKRCLKKKLDCKDDDIKQLKITVNKLIDIKKDNGNYIDNLKETNNLTIAALVIENEKIKNTLAYKVLAKLKMA